MKDDVVSDRFCVYFVQASKQRYLNSMFGLGPPASAHSLQVRRACQRSGWHNTRVMKWARRGRHCASDEVLCACDPRPRPPHYRCPKPARPRPQELLLLLAHYGPFDASMLTSRAATRLVLSTYTNIETKLSKYLQTSIQVICKLYYRFVFFRPNPINSPSIVRAIKKNIIYKIIVILLNKIGAGIRAECIIGTVFDEGGNEHEVWLSSVALF